MVTGAGRWHAGPVQSLPASPPPRKLLIVDDSAEMRRLLRRLCAHAFAEIHECADGEEAVAAFAEQRPDWVLMDIAMARQDGLSATARILARDPAARIIIVSQHDDVSFREAAARSGAVAFVSKHDLNPLRRLLGLEPGAANSPFSDVPPVQVP